MKHGTIAAIIIMSMMGSAHAAQAINVELLQMPLADAALFKGEIIEATGVECTQLQTYRLPNGADLGQCIWNDPAALGFGLFYMVRDGGVIAQHKELDPVVAQYYDGAKLLNVSQNRTEFVIVVAD